MSEWIPVEERVPDVDEYCIGRKEGYIEGIEQVWEIVRKILSKKTVAEWDGIKEYFHVRDLYDIFFEYTASEIMDKLGKYEEQQIQSIKSCLSCQNWNYGTPRYVCTMCDNKNKWQLRQTDVTDTDDGDQEVEDDT